MPRYDILFKEITSIIENDYAGYEEKKEKHHPRFYVHAVGQAYKDRRLNELLFLQYMSQYLITLQDYHLHLQLNDSETYTSGTLGFMTRRVDEYLYVTEVNEEERLQVGDVILEINGKSPKYHRDHIVQNIFGSDISYDENFNGLLKMANHMKVRHVDGSEEVLEIKKYKPTTVKTNTISTVGHQEVLTINHLDETAVNLLQQVKNKNIVIDLRHCLDGDMESVFAYVNQISQKEVSLKELMKEEGFYTNFTTRNCEYKCKELEYLFSHVEDEYQPMVQEMIDDYKSKSGQGWLYDASLDIENDEVIGGNSKFNVTFLVDCYTANAGEWLVYLARKVCDCKVVGRSTSGMFNYSNEVSVFYDEKFLFQYPMSKRKEVYESHECKGIEPDTCIPFTVEECTSDILLNQVI